MSDPNAQPIQPPSLGVLCAEPFRALGYDAFDWDQGVNADPQGDLDAWLQTLKSRVVDLLSGHTQPATLIGWSLGGIYARELGKLMAPSIRQVIMIGRCATSVRYRTDYSRQRNDNQ